MTTSTAITGSKRGAVDEDGAAHQTDETRQWKRMKPAGKTSSNGDQTISHYFTRNQSRTKESISTRSSKGSKAAEDSKASEHSTRWQSSPKAASAKRAAQRKDRSISPPTSSRQNRSSMSSTSNQPADKKSSSPKRDATDKNPISSLSITHHIGDIFDAPANSLLIHACNCKGSWGKGIAESFKRRYPAAFKVYQAHCKKTPNKQLIGTALLIPPQRNDRYQQFIGCLFTSAATGK